MLYSRFCECLKRGPGFHRNPTAVISISSPNCYTLDSCVHCNKMKSLCRHLGETAPGGSTLTTTNNVRKRGARVHSAPPSPLLSDPCLLFAGGTTCSSTASRCGQAYACPAGHTHGGIVPANTAAPCRIVPYCIYQVYHTAFIPHRIAPCKRYHTIIRSTILIYT